MVCTPWKEPICHKAPETNQGETCPTWWYLAGLFVLVMVLTGGRGVKGSPDLP